MLESNITLSESLNIMIKNRKSSKEKEFLNSIKNSLILNNQTTKVFSNFKVDSSVISFFEIIEKSSNINENLKALYTLLKEKEKIKKDISKAIKYPIVLMLSFIVSMFSIFYFVVPKFKLFFKDFKDDIPLAAKFLFYLQENLETYFLVLILFCVLIVLSSYFLYKTNEEFSYKVDVFIVNKFPFLSQIYLFYELYRLFLVLEIMLNSNYEFNNALKASKTLLKNKYLLDRITVIENLLQNGKTISYSFEKSSLFDDLILNLINLGEASNSLEKVVKDIKKIYKDRFNKKVNLFISMIQPLFIFMIMGLILWIVMAILVPIWDMGNMLKV